MKSVQAQTYLDELVVICKSFFEGSFLRYLLEKHWRKREKEKSVTVEAKRAHPANLTGLPEVTTGLVMASELEDPTDL